MGTDLNRLRQEIDDESKLSIALKNELSSVIIGQEHLLNSLLIVLYSGGHILLEGLPGLAKTLTIKTLAASLHTNFSRIQFTPDLLPADVLGTMIYNQRKEEFVIRKGPLFANLVLADEINRAPAKVQSALLEAMQERQITIGDESFPLEEPFMVMATQNPIEQEGTYTLPEAQLDRFLMKVVITYPEIDEELQIIRQGRITNSIPSSSASPPAKVPLNSTSAFTSAKVPLNKNPQNKIFPADIIRIRSLVQKVHLDELLEKYILNLVFATRFPEKHNAPSLKGLISYGASPRASLGLVRAAQAHAFTRGSHYAEPEDVQAVAYDIMRHRIGISFEGLAENMNTDQVIAEILKVVPVP